MNAQLSKEALARMPMEYIEGCQSFSEVDGRIMLVHEFYSPIMYEPKRKQWVSGWGECVGGLQAIM